MRESGHGADFEGVLIANQDRISTILQELTTPGVKVYISLVLEMKKTLDDVLATAVFNSPTKVFIPMTNVSAEVGDMFPTILEKVDKYLRNGSGYIVHRVLNLNINITR